MKIGDRVTVSSDSQEYKGKYVNCSGVIRVFHKRKTFTLIGVLIDGEKNKSSSYEVYWFNKDCLIKEEEYVMFNNFKVADVKFLDGRGHVLCCALFDNHILVGDKVVVKTRSHGFVIGEVIRVHEDVKTVMEGREVICLADFTGYEKRQEAKKRAIELKKSIDKKVKENTEMVVYEMFAEKDPELKKMLEEFKGIMKEY